MIGVPGLADDDLISTRNSDHNAKRERILKDSLLARLTTRY